MLRKVKAFLDSLFNNIISFIPPWNSYDEDILIALENTGFKCISGCLTIC